MKAHLLIFSVVAGALAQTPEGRQSVSAEERARIEAALPAKAPAAPRKHRSLLIVDYANGRAGHPSIPHADLAVELMGKKTGAYETVISHDASRLEPASLRGFDAVYLNNAQGPVKRRSHHSGPRGPAAWRDVDSRNGLRRASGPGLPATSRQEFANGHL